MIRSISWTQVKNLLEADKEDLVEKLINEIEHDKSMLIRGRIQQINLMLETYPHQFSDKYESD